MFRFFFPLFSVSSYSADRKYVLLGLVDGDPAVVGCFPASFFFVLPVASPGGARPRGVLILPQARGIVCFLF